MPASLSTLTLTRSRGRGGAPGTCGELAQGVLPDGTPFVVTCPIDRGTTVSVTLAQASALEIVGVPAGRTYLDRALRRTAELLELGPCRVIVEHHTDLPVGKGMASSTADIVAAARSLARAAGVALAASDLAVLATSIEPSDGTMYDGIVASDPRSGRKLREWSWWPQFVVVAAVPPATFETRAARLDGQSAYADEYAMLLERLDLAVAQRDSGAFARVATRSAELGQAFVENETYARLTRHAEALGALGTCAGHTGTVAGLLYAQTRAGEAAAQHAARTLRAALSQDHEVFSARTPAWPAAAPAAPSVDG